MSISLSTQSRTISTSSYIEIAQYIPENCYVEQQLKRLEVSSTGKFIVSSVSTSNIIDICNEYRMFNTEINFSKLVVSPESTDQLISIRQIIY